MSSHKKINYELRYTLRVDPKEVHGEDFPGETFRVVEEKEVRLYGDASQSDNASRFGGMGWARSRMKDETVLKFIV